MVVIVCGIIVLPAKRLIQRERPTLIKSRRRICNMRERENGTGAMPSGDATAASIILGCYAFLFGCPWLFLICLPLVCLGRVYTFCHWFSDVLVGSIIGTVSATLVFHIYFVNIATPFYHAIMKL